MLFVEYVVCWAWQRSTNNLQSTIIHQETTIANQLPSSTINNQKAASKVKDQLSKANIQKSAINNQQSTTNKSSYKTPKLPNPLLFHQAFNLFSNLRWMPKRSFTQFFASRCQNSPATLLVSPNWQIYLGMPVVPPRFTVAFGIPENVIILVVTIASWMGRNPKVYQQKISRKTAIAGRKVDDSKPYVRWSVSIIPCNKGLQQCLKMGCLSLWRCFFCLSPTSSHEFWVVWQRIFGWSGAITGKSSEQVTGSKGNSLMPKIKG